MNENNNQERDLLEVIYNHKVTQVILLIGKLSATIYLLYMAWFFYSNIEELKEMNNPCAWAEKHEIRCCDTYQVINPFLNVTEYFNKTTKTLLNITPFK